MTRPYKALTLKESRITAPQPEGVGAWAEKLRTAAFNAVKEEDITELMGSLMKRAKEGDINASRLVLSYLTAPQKTQQVVVMQTRSAELSGEDVSEMLARPLGYTPPKEDDPQKATLRRRCLRCDKEFESHSKHNRVCGNCA